MSRPKHIRETIIDSLIAMLRTIGVNTGAGENWAATKRPSVERYKRGVTTGTWPLIVVSVGSEQYSIRGTCGEDHVRDSTMLVTIAYYDVGSEKDQMASDMVHDVMKLLGTDPSLQGTARDSFVPSNQTLTGEEEDGSVLVLFTVEVVYGHMAKDPSMLA